MLIGLSPLALAGGWLLDLALGDPRWLPHPVRGMGRVIVLLERGLGRWRTRAAGIALVAGTLASVAACWFILTAALVRLGVPRDAVDAVVVFYCLATRSLLDASRAVEKFLAAGMLPAARRALAGIVGRDTDRLSEPEVVRAAVETVAESACDGIVAPLVWLALLGPLGGLLFKAASTLDSMVGHDDDRYRELGWAAARLDDLLNWLPARMTALLFILPALFHGRAGRSWAVVVRDHGRHRSPNAGWPEAAMAGLLGVRLGGATWYAGERLDRPTLGDAEREKEPADIGRANRAALAVSALMMMLAVLGLGIARRIGGC